MTRPGKHVLKVDVNLTREREREREREEGGREGGRERQTEVKRDVCEVEGRERKARGRDIERETEAE